MRLSTQYFLLTKLNYISFPASTACWRQPLLGSFLCSPTPNTWDDSIPEPPPHAVPPAAEHKPKTPNSTCPFGGYCFTFNSIWARESEQVRPNESTEDKQQLNPPLNNRVSGALVKPALQSQPSLHCHCSGVCSKYRKAIIHTGTSVPVLARWQIFNVLSQSQRAARLLKVSHQREAECSSFLFHYADNRLANNRFKWLSLSCTQTWINRKGVASSCSWTNSCTQSCLANVVLGQYVQYATCLCVHCFVCIAR